MTSDLLMHLAVSPALAMLPPGMDTPSARALMVAIAYQESRIRARRQYEGPARGFWQFERGGGVEGVLGHPRTREFARDVCEALSVPATAGAVYVALEWHDVLAATFARLLLWTLPGHLPRRDQEDEAWSQYIAAWRPGKPHESTWRTAWAVGWAAVDGLGSDS